MQVIKRDETLQDFKLSKIERVILKALKDNISEDSLDCDNEDETEEEKPHTTYAEEAKRLAKEVGDTIKYYYKDKDKLHVNQIQEVVDLILMENYPEAAYASVEYRNLEKSTKEDLEYLNYMDAYVANGDNAATSSQTDPNANVMVKNVANLEGEVYKKRNRRIQRRRMRRKLRELFPELADQYEKDLETHIIYVHDESNSPVVKNYCEAVSLYPLLMEGTNGLDHTGNVPPKRLSSFQGQMVNLAFLLASQCKGAVAFGEFFNVFDYYAVKEFGPEYHKHDSDWADTEFVQNRQTIGGKIEQYFQGIIHGWNQPSGNRSYQSPFTNISYYDSNYWKALFGDFYFPDGTQPSWERVDYLQKKFMKWFNKERTKTLLTFPVETMALLSDGKDIIDKDYKNFTAEMYAAGHSFFTYISDNPNSLSSCCRLRNEITENTFSFTNGLTGVQTGSCNVITLNLNRITQNYYNSCDEEGKAKIMSHDYSDFKPYLQEIIERVHKYHIAYKTMLYEIEDAGMLTPSNADYIKMDKLYSTVGENGINEAARFLGMEVSYNDDYKDFCRFFTGTISEMNKKNSTPRFRFNQEFVPAEGLGSKNYNWDKNDGYWVPTDENLYNSYFYDAHDTTTILDKMKMHGREFTELLDGGVGCHLNLEDHLSKDQYMTLIDFAIKVGCSYFTFNIPNTKCEDCGFITKHPIDVCPKCGSKNVQQWTRVIGYLRPVSSFDRFRQVEANHRYYAQDIK